MTKPFSPDYVSRRRPLAAYVASGALAFVVAVAAAAPPAAASTSITVTMTASSTSVEAGQSVTLTASASRNMSGTGQYLEVYDQTGGRVLVACGSGTTCTTTVTQPSASTRTYRAQAAKSTTASGVTAQSGALTVTWTDRPATDPVMVAAGDIACDPADPNFGGTSSSTCQMAATANLIKQINPSYLLPIGDTQYANNAQQGQPPTLAQYTNGYGASWGQLPAAISGLKVRPASGNHEWGDITETQAPPLSASTYFQYFGSTLPSGVNATNDWYSFDVPVSGGTWHIISLDSECGAIGGCGAGSAQETWLRNDLQAHPSTCTAAYWHEPRWSAGDAGNDPRYTPFWQDLYAAHATVVLNGHDHDYEHFTPQNPNGAADATGLSEFVVGTGGVGLESFPTTAPNTQYRDNTKFGVLQMTLHSSGMDYAFRTTAGTTPDAGTIACGVTGPGPGAPVVSGVGPVWGPSVGGTVVTVTGSNLSGATVVKFGTAAATNVTVNSASSITATAPAGSTTVDVTVTTPSGTSPASVNDQYTYTYANNGYTVALTSTATTPTIGTSVTLTATANQDMGPTPYGISIFDATTNVEVAHTGYGTTVTFTVSQPTASTHRYVGLIANTGALNIQAESTPIIITWS